MNDGHMDRRVLAHRHGPRARIASVDADGNLCRAGGVRAEIVDAQNDGGILVDDGETRGIDDGQLAIALILAAHDQRMQRRADGGFLRRVVDFAVGDQDRACDAFRRHIGERGIERRKELRAVVLPGRLRRDRCDAHLKALVRSQLFPDLGESLGSVCRAVLDAHALRTVDDHGGDVGERLARLMHDQRIGEDEDSGCQRQTARPGAARTSEKGIGCQRQRNADRHPHKDHGHEGREIDRGCHVSASAVPAGRERAPGRPCSFRSACTSPG